jgi:hypothetical protein
VYAPSGGIHGNLTLQNKQGMDPFHSNSPQGTHVGLVDVTQTLLKEHMWDWWRSHKQETPNLLGTFT